MPSNTVIQPAPEHSDQALHLQELSATFRTRGEVVYSGRNILKRMQWDGIKVMVKSFAVPNRLRGLIYGQIRRSKAAKSFEHALHLKTHEICTPDPIGFVEVRKGPLLRESFYACKEWSYDFTVREPLLDAQFNDRNAILAALGRFAWQLHRKNIYHKDFSPGNILIKQAALDMTDSGSQWEFCLVDVNRMRFGSLSLNDRMRNFAMLWANDVDLEAIVRAYAQESGDPPADAIRIAIDCSRQHKTAAHRKERLKALFYR